MESKHFEEIGELISGNNLSSLFGKPCYKKGRKAFILFYKDQIVCKLFDDVHKEAIALEGTDLFNPRGKGKPMANWVMIPFKHKSKWKYFAKLAYDFVENE